MWWQGLHRADSVRLGLYMSSVEPVLLSVSLVVLGVSGIKSKLLGYLSLMSVND